MSSYWIRSLSPPEMRNLVEIYRFIFFLKAPYFLYLSILQVTFKDEADVLNVVADLVEVMVMFDSPVQLNVALKQGRGGDPGSWQRLAERRAETLKEHLVKSGRSEETPTG